MGKYLTMNKIVCAGLTFFCSLLNLSCGALSTVLLCLREEWRDIKPIVIIAASSMISGLVLFFQALFPRIDSLVYASSTLAFVTLGASVAQIFYMFRNSKLEELDYTIVTAQLCIILFIMLFSGLIFRLSVDIPQIDRRVEILSDSNIAKEEQKFIPMKTSAQTLTPDLEDGLEQKGAFKEYSKASSTSDAISTPSVIKHTLPPLSQQSISSTTIKSRFKNASFTTRSPTSRKQVIEKIQTKLCLKSPSNKEKSNTNPSFVSSQNSATDDSIDAKFVTRLSTIPDASKSHLNMVKQTNDVSSIVSLCLKDTEHLDAALLKLEKDAIDLYDKVLLPPILQQTNFSSSIVGYLTNSASIDGLKNHNFDYNEYGDHDNENGDANDDAKLEKLIETDLQIAALSSPCPVIEGCSSKPEDEKSLGSHINIEDWEQNKEQLLEDQKLMFSNATTTLPPLFHVEQNFSFPNKQNDFDYNRANNGYIESEDDMLSLFDKTTKFYDENYMNEVLRQDTSPLLAEINPSYSHSPTKSIQSIPSSYKTPIKLDTTFLASQHEGNCSQISIYLHQNNSKQAFSTQSSPIRLTKKLGKRLSKTNLKIDTESKSTYNHLHSKSLTLTSIPQNEVTQYTKHIQSNSVNHVDLSYVQSLQRRDSSQRSISSAKTGRRGSIFQSAIDFRLPNCFVSKQEVFEDSDEFVETDGQEIIESMDDDSLNFEDKFKKTNSKLSEYDREKLMILLSRNQNGHNKSSPVVL